VNIQGCYYIWASIPKLSLKATGSKKGIFYKKYKRGKKDTVMHEEINTVDFILEEKKCIILKLSDC
jgi:hypothetical protein